MHPDGEREFLPKIIRKAYFLYNSSNFKEAYHISTEGLNLAPNNPELLLLRGLVSSLSKDNCDEGISDINKAINTRLLSEKSLDLANWHLGRAYLQKKLNYKAEEYFARIKDWSKLRKRSEANQQYRDYIISHKSHAVEGARISDEKIVSFWGNLIVNGEKLYDHISDQIKSCSRPLSVRYERAINFIDYFLDMYPLNLYSIVLKSLEMVFLQDHLIDFNSESTIAEIAIGEGSFSNLVFQDLGLKLIGFDISPYSLQFAAQKPHVLGTVVSDAKNPPIHSGCLDLIVSNNFLHHVSSKIDVLNHFAQTSNYVLFNESTYEWARGHPGPFTKRESGWPNIAKYLTEMECERNAQHLLSIPELNQIISQAGFQVIDCFSFLSRSSIYYSKILEVPVYLPVQFHEILMNSEMLIKVKELTKKLATMLIVYDYYQDRSFDAYVSYYAQSSKWQKSQHTKMALSCIECQGRISIDDSLQSNIKCPHCHSAYPCKKGMIFILPDGLKDICDSFDEHINVEEIHL